MAHTDAVALFSVRAQAVDPSFEGDGAAAEICRRLDELPLAVELAAARVKAFTAAEIVNRLERRLPLLTGASGPCRASTHASGDDRLEPRPADAE